MPARDDMGRCLLIEVLESGGSYSLICKKIHTKSVGAAGSVTASPPKGRDIDNCCGFSIVRKLTPTTAPAMNMRYWRNNGLSQSSKATTKCDQTNLCLAVRICRFARLLQLKLSWREVIEKHGICRRSENCGGRALR